MKAIMISIKPKWCAEIMNGNKTIEVRKNKALATAIQKLIDENGYADIYVYCSKINRKHYHLLEVVDTDIEPDKTEYEIDYFIGGSKDYLDLCYESKVAFKFRCYKVEEHKDFLCMFPYSNLRYNKSTCLTEEEIENYGFVNEKGYVPLYAIHISDLEIFDMPKELSEFKKNNATGNCWKCKLFGSGCSTCQLTKAPQNFCYVEVEQ